MGQQRMYWYMPCHLEGASLCAIYGKKWAPEAMSVQLHLGEQYQVAVVKQHADHALTITTLAISRRLCAAKSRPFMFDENVRRIIMARQQEVRKSDSHESLREAKSYSTIFRAEK